MLRTFGKKKETMFFVFKIQRRDLFIILKKAIGQLNVLNKNGALAVPHLINATFSCSSFSNICGQTCANTCLSTHKSSHGSRHVIVATRLTSRNNASSYIKSKTTAHFLD